jgi:hypothetical protein
MMPAEFANPTRCGDRFEQEVQDWLDSPEVWSRGWLS